MLYCGSLNVYRVRKTRKMRGRGPLPQRIMVYICLEYLNLVYILLLTAGPYQFMNHEPNSTVELQRMKSLHETVLIVLVCDCINMTKKDTERRVVLLVSSLGTRIMIS